MVDLSDIDGIVARRRRFAYVAVFTVLFFTYFYLRDSTWRGDSQLHTLMETVATVLSLAVGSLALVRYYSKKENNFLFIGTGFAVTALLDGYHAVVSSSYFIETFPSAPHSLMAWSWFASRIFLSLLLWLSWLFWQHEDRRGVAGLISEKLVYGTVTALALVCFAVIAFVPMPVAYYQLFSFMQPQEFLPALFFLLALIGYLRKGKWKTDAFEHWLVLSLIVGFMGQVMFMSFSGRLFDMMFVAANLLKIGSYICAMIGLLLSMQRLFSESHVQSELQFMNILLTTQQEASPDAILVVDDNENIISYNRNFILLWGLTQEIVAAGVDGPVLQSVAAQVSDHETFLARVHHLYQHKSEKSHEEILLRDGRILDRYSAPMLGENGKYYGRIWFFRDISKRKLAEQMAMDERNFSNKLIANQPDLFFVLDQTGQFIRWNDKMRVILGYSDAQLAASNALAIVHEADRPAVAQKIQETFEQGVATVNARLITKRGIRDYVFNATGADTAKGTYLVGVGTDITERKLAETMLHESEERLHAIFEGALDGILLAELETRQLIEGNSAFCRMLGYSAEELPRLSIPDLHRQQDWPSVLKQFEQQARGEIRLAEGLPVKRKDGSVFYADINSSTVNIGGKHYIVGVFRDITEPKQVHAELLESELAYRTLAQNLPGMVYRVFVREGDRMQFYNEMPAQLTGYAADELSTGAVCSIEPLILDEDRPAVMAEVRRAIADKRAFMVEYRLKHKDGGIRWMAEHGMPVYGTDGVPLYIDGVIFDITEHKRAEIELELFRTLLDNSSDSIDVLDPATLRFLDVNETECRDLGYSREEMLSMKITDIDHVLNTDSIKEIEEQIRQNGEAQFEGIHRRKDGSTFPVEVNTKLVELDRPYALNIVRDITRRKLAEAEVLKLQVQLREQAVHDPLTGLYNRRYLDETIERELVRAERYNQPIGIVMCDLDNFKLVNDTHGHLAGDEVLRVFAGLLKKHARGSDIVCRFGGEEFVLFLPDMPPDVAYQRAEQLRAELAAIRITLGPAVIRVTASFGVAAFPENGKTMDSLIRAVDAAMYQAKEGGRDRVVVSSAGA